MYKQIWHDSIARDIDFLGRHIEKSPFATWEKNQMPSYSVEENLTLGIEIRFGDGDHALAQRYFERCRTVHARAMLENKYATVDTTRFPENRANGNFADEFAGALIEDRPLNPTALRKSLTDLQAFHGAAQKPLMDGNMWSARLSLSEAFVVAGDIEGGAVLLKIIGSKPKFADRIKIVRALANGKGLDDLNFRTEFARFFDWMRNPANPGEFYTISVRTKLLWGALYEFRVLGNEPFTWDRAFAAASA